MIHARCGIAALTTSERRRARCEACVAGRERQRSRGHVSRNYGIAVPVLVLQHLILPSPSGDEY